jgi:uncharacterized integral membrane protein
VIALGIICLLIGAAVVVLMLAVGFTTITFSTFAGNVITRPFWVFLLGAATLLIVMMGLSLLRRGTRRQVQRRREIKRLRKAEQTQPAAGPDTASEPGAVSDAGTSTGSGTGARSGTGTGAGGGSGVTGGTGSGPGDRGADDAPDRTLVREQRPDVR